MSIATGGLPPLLANGPLPPLYRNTTTLQAAVQGGTLGVGYSAGGYLVAYFVGVSKVLHQLGIIEKGKTRTAGSSSGGLAQLVDHPYGPTHDAFVDGSVDFVDYCRSTHKCSDHLDEAFSQLFVKLIDPKTPFLKNYDKRCSVYAVYNATAQKGEGRYRCECDSLQDTIDLLRTSVYVPGWSHPRNKYTTYRGQPAYDGAFVQPMPCPPNTTFCIKVLGVVPAEPEIYLRAFKEHPEYFGTTLGTMGDFLREALNSDPMAALNVNYQEWFGLFTASSSDVADIYPGKYSKSPISPLETIYAIFTPPKPETVRALYAAGQADAYAWAKEQGWALPRKNGL